MIAFTIIKRHHHRVTSGIASLLSTAWSTVVFNNLLIIFSYSTKNVICCYNICSGGAESSTTVFWLRTSKRRSPLVCQSVPPCLTKPSFPPDSQIMCSRVTDVLHKPPPPLCSPSSLCRLCSQKGDEQLRRTAGRSLGGPDLPPWRASLPACLHISLNSFVRAVRRWGRRWHEAEQAKSRDARRAHSTSEINENGLALPKIERPAQKVAANIGARLLCFMINSFDLLQLLWRSCYISLAIKSNTLGDWLTKLTFPLAF